MLEMGALQHAACATPMDVTIRLWSNACAKPTKVVLVAVAKPLL